MDTTPEDPIDEPLTDEQLDQIEQGLADGAAGRLTPHAEVVAMIAEWNNVKRPPPPQR